MVKEGGPKAPASLWQHAINRFHQYDAAGDYEEAQAIALELFDINPKKRGEISYCLGLTWWRNGEDVLARKHFVQALDFLSWDDPTRIRVYNELSLLHQARGAWTQPFGSLIGWIGLLEKRKKFGWNENLRQAENWSKHARNIWEAYEERLHASFAEKQSLWYQTSDVFGLAFTAAGDFFSARFNHQQIIESAGKTGHLIAVACTQNNLGLAHYFGALQTPHLPKRVRFSLDTAAECFRWRLEHDEDKASVGYGIVLSNLGRVLEAQGKRAEATTAYNQSAQVAQEIGQETLFTDAEEHLHRLSIEP